MINDALINPKSICVVGASSNLSKPGGKILRNLILGNYPFPIYPINPNEKTIQGIKSFASVDEIQEADLAILIVHPIDCLNATKILLREKKTKAIIIISAGFSELDQEGKNIETELVKLITEANATLIGPNCIGVLTKNYQGVFTTPIPQLVDDGCDLISSSGATAVFLMESGIPNGLKFSSVFSVGNAAQTNVADILEYLDETYIPGKSASIKLLYIENILNPYKLLKHAKSLIQKGCRIAAIKAGTTSSGLRAAASHTGAMANPDLAVKALFKKAGIVMCKSRQELITVAGIFKYKELKGKNIAIITHAGGSAVMLTDALCKGGLNVPELSGTQPNNLLTYLNKGSSVKNPIDFLATGTAEQLGIIIDYCEHKFDEIDAMVVVFGSPGLFDVENAYRVLSVKLEVCKKPIYPVLPSLINAQKEISYFLSKGYINFPDEVILGEGMASVYQTEKPQNIENFLFEVSIVNELKNILSNEQDFIPPEKCYDLFNKIGLKQAKQKLFYSKKEIECDSENFNFPVVAKIVGPLHKSDSGGIILNILDKNGIIAAFEKIMQIEDAQGVLIQEMLIGTELFIGVKYEPNFGHMILYGFGGIFVEILDDFQYNILPVSNSEIQKQLIKLKGASLFEGARGRAAISKDEFSSIIQTISKLINSIPQITELDLNPLIATKNGIFVVDSRIRYSNLQ